MLACRSSSKRALYLLRRHATKSQRNNVPRKSARLAPALFPASGTALLVGYHTAVAVSVQPPTTACEMAVAVPPKPLEFNDELEHSSTWERIRRGWRVLWRLLKLSWSLAPVAALYPIYWMLPDPQYDPDQDARELILAEAEGDGEKDLAAAIRRWYLRLCLGCAERSGAAVVKLLQWAGSRPDLFGREFCDVFSKLQDDTTPHSWKHTNRAMRTAYGKDWEEKIQLGEILGSGCIGQVYRGSIVTKGDGQRQDVAVKILHPHVEDDMEADLDLLRFAAFCVTKLQGGSSWLNWQDLVEEFARILRVQLDLRYEARNMARFAENFKDWDDIVAFPELVPQFPPIDKHVLVESFLDGVPVLEFARENRHDKERLRNMCNRAIKAVCKMIFLDNFVHGDLHPGNVFVNREGNQFLMFDLGIATEYSDHDHEVIVDILSAFIQREGFLAGERMMDDTHYHNKTVKNGEKFCRKMAILTDRASGKEYFMQHLGDYISYICKAAADHHIRINPAFISMALAIKVQEGIALALDPTVKIIKVATPIIVESESRRRLQMRWKNVEDWAKQLSESLFGEKETTSSDSDR